ncbi:hypothetical protein FACS189451_08930 [Bacteroidia bacterium]|nr:hypothetical protein FACS189451_08930 [Bacteroidia bacterium]
MARKSKEIIWPHLNDCNGDVTRKWYVEFSVRNIQTGEMVRTRIHEGFDKHITAEGKYQYAKKIIREYQSKLKTGWKPFEEIEIEYKDSLAYHFSSTFSGKIKKLSPVKCLLSEYLEYKKPSIKKSSYDDYKSKLRQFSLYLENNNLINKNLSLINNKVIINFLRMMAEDRAVKTIQKYQQVISDFFKFIKEEKKINIENPINEDIPRLGKIVDESPDGIPHQIRKQLKNKMETEQPQLWLACCFIYYTAIRPGTELRLMKIKQINFQSKTITVINELAKNSRTETIDIPDKLYEIITDQYHLYKYDPEMFVLGKNGEPGYEHLGKNTMPRRFNLIRNELKLSKSIKYYSWKHSGAQELADSGISTYELQRHMRHRDLATTESYLKKRIGQRSDIIKHNFPIIG